MRAWRGRFHNSALSSRDVPIVYFFLRFKGGLGHWPPTNRGLPPYLSYFYCTTLCSICRRRVSVCLSVCLSDTLQYYIKTAKRRITQIMPHDSAGNLVFCCQKSRRNSNGIIPYGGDKCRWGGLKLVTFNEKRAITRKRYKIDV